MGSSSRQAGAHRGGGSNGLAKKCGITVVEDAAKARELYAKAFAGGVQEANDRLNALRE